MPFLMLLKQFMPSYLDSLKINCLKGAFCLSEEFVGRSTDLGLEYQLFQLTVGATQLVTGFFVSVSCLLVVHLGLDNLLATIRSHMTYHQSFPKLFVATLMPLKVQVDLLQLMLPHLSLEKTQQILRAGGLCFC